MAVKSAKKAIEAAGLPTGTLEEAQEGPQEGQGAPEKEEAGENTQEPEKPQEKPQEGRETLVYVGPSLPRGMLKQNSIFVGTREEVEKSLEEAIKTC